MEKCNKVLTSEEKVRTRLKDILDTDFPNRKMAALISGKSEDMLANYVSGKTAIPFSAMIELAKYAKVSLDWLAFGLGQKYLKDVVKQDKGAVPIRVFDISVSAGPGCFVDDELVHSTITLSEQFVKAYGLSSSCVGVFITGDSMEPKLKTTDTAIIDVAITEFEDDNIYVFSFENHCYIKQLQKIGKEIKVKSLNPDYENWSITPDKEDSFKIIGKLQLVIRKP